MLHKLHSLLFLSGEARAQSICLPCLRRIGYHTAMVLVVNCEQLVTFVCLHKNVFALTFSLWHPLPTHFVVKVLMGYYLNCWTTEPYLMLQLVIFHASSPWCSQRETAELMVCRSACAVFLPHTFIFNVRNHHPFGDSTVARCCFAFSQMSEADTSSFHRFHAFQHCHC
jgi:hypothetical protein